jgi:hypothetical protein
MLVEAMNTSPATRSTVGRLRGWVGFTEGPLGDFEAAAARVVARLVGERVILQDDGSQDGMADIRIDYANQSPGFVEVWTDVDPRYAATYSRLLGRGRGLPFELPMATVRRNWFVTVASTSDLRILEAELEGLLADLEAQGVTFEIVADRRALTSQSDENVRRLLELGVVRLSCGLPSPGGGLARLYLEGAEGPAVVAWAPVVDWIEETLASERLLDVRTKLMRTGAPERHVFLGVTFTSPGEVYFALSLQEPTLPDVALEVPHEITHVWLMSAPPLGRCLAWFPDRGWLDVRRHWVTD